MKCLKLKSIKYNHKKINIIIKMVKFLKIIDIFPQSFSFTYKGKKSLKTELGGIMSIISSITLMFVAVLIGNDIYFREKPSVIEFSTKEKLTPTFRLNTKNDKIGFSISKWIDLIDDPSFLKIQPIFYIQTKNKLGNYIYREYTLELEDCENSEDRTIYYHKCIKNLDVYLTGSWTEDSIAYLRLDMNKCSNETYVPSTNIETEEDNKILDEFEKNIQHYHKSKYILDKEFNEGLNLHEYLKEYQKNLNLQKRL